MSSTCRVHRRNIPPLVHHQPTAKTRLYSVWHERQPSNGEKVPVELPDRVVMEIPDAAVKDLRAVVKD